MAPRRHVAHVPLRWADLDAQGHVNNAKVVDLLQEARASMMRTGRAPSMLGGGVVVAGQQVSYLRPIAYAGESVEVEVGVATAGASRFTVAYEVRQDGVPCAQALTTLCPFDFTTQRPRRLTADERAALADDLAPAVELSPLAAPHLHGRGHRYDLVVRWSDLDAYGHVNNVRYFDYVQEARVAMTTAADPSMARGGATMLWLVARQDVDNLAQMDSRAEPFAVHTAPVALGRTSATFACEVTDPAREHLVLARARTVLVCAGLDGRPQPLPEHTRAVLEGLLVS